LRVWNKWLGCVGIYEDLISYGMEAGVGLVI